MIRLLKHGDYTLCETPDLTRVLTLSDKGSYTWAKAKGIGEILTSSQKDYPVLYFLALGKYRIYEVRDETRLTDTVHIELFVGKGTWQGFLLISGLPSGAHKKVKILPTEEIITKSNNSFRPQPTHAQALISHL